MWWDWNRKYADLLNNQLWYVELKQRLTKQIGQGGDFLL